MPIMIPFRTMLFLSLVSLLLSAVLSVFASVILVLNTLTALITQQTHQIGIIKAMNNEIPQFGGQA